MRRRALLVTTSLPPRLAVFDAAVWPGRDAAERYSGWIVARSGWADDHDLDVVPGDAEAYAAFPDGEFRSEDI